MSRSRCTTWPASSFHIACSTPRSTLCMLWKLFIGHVHISKQLNIYPRSIFTHDFVNVRWQAVTLNNEIGILLSEKNVAILVAQVHLQRSNHNSIRVFSASITQKGKREQLRDIIFISLTFGCLDWWYIKAAFQHTILRFPTFEIASFCLEYNHKQTENM